MNEVSYTPIIIAISNIISVSIIYLTSQSTAKNVEIKFADTYKCDVFCDVNMIQTVLKNLISNAIKYSNYGSTIEIIVSDYPQNHSFIQIAIKDYGVGMHPNEVNKLFRIDEKIVSSKGTNQETGTGLGLILCKEFMDKHNCPI